MCTCFIVSYNYPILAIIGGLLLCLENKAWILKQTFAFITWCQVGYGVSESGGKKIDAFWLSLCLLADITFQSFFKISKYVCDNKR